MDDGAVTGKAMLDLAFRQSSPVAVSVIIRIVFMRLLFRAENGQGDDVVRPGSEALFAGRLNVQ